MKPLIASEQVEDQVNEMNENNLAMDEVPSSEVFQILIFSFIKAFLRLRL
jgi:predicted SpoU family rRNA methylase